ncbi:MAG TPA: FAD-dependent oxidoreductase [Methylomirabilota bacterium]|nr:FAD-dependent oxidoreductase [Methylomirabilota bacterium]
MKVVLDLAVIGSGFGGSLLAMIARRLGLRVALIERGRHPRFAIGESSTPLANLLLEELAHRYDLPCLRPLAKWGSWQRDHPEIGCGLKRGFTFYHHRTGQAWIPSEERDNELLVAASPHDGIADTHWYRPDFDHFLVHQALTLGVEYFDETELSAAVVGTDSCRLEGRRLGRPVHFDAEFVVDATGPRGFLHRALRLPEGSFPGLPHTQALYTHFRDVVRWEQLHPSAAVPPYPVDDAAVHHVFEGGWVWVLRFNNGLTSAGLAATDTLAEELNLREGGPAWARLLARFPDIGKLFTTARPAQPWRHTPHLSFRSSRVSGSRWALLPSAAGFVDPLLSTGFPLTLFGIARLAEILARPGDLSARARGLADYETITLAELDAAARLVTALYRHLGDFPLFARLALLYFGAASFSEAARRLGRPELTGDSFLLTRRADLAGRLHELLDRALEPLTHDTRAALMDDVLRFLEPLDVAGLTNSTRRNWFPARAEDLVLGASKLGVDESCVRHLLARCGFDPKA